VSADDVRLAELLAALSVATDLGMGQEPEKAVRACLIATQLARAMDLPDRDVRDVYYCTLLQHLGCTAPAHETTYLFGDDLTGAPQAERTDENNPREVLALLALAIPSGSSGRGVDFTTPSRNIGCAGDATPPCPRKETAEEEGQQER
jgi:hypothetical protein